MMVSATFLAADTVVVGALLGLCFWSIRRAATCSSSWRSESIPGRSRPPCKKILCLRTSQVKNLERRGAEEESVPYADVARFLQVDTCLCLCMIMICRDGLSH